MFLIFLAKFIPICADWKQMLSMILLLESSSLILRCSFHMDHWFSRFSISAEFSYLLRVSFFENKCVFISVPLCGCWFIIASQIAMVSRLPKKVLKVSNLCKLLHGCCCFLIVSKVLWIDLAVGFFQIFLNRLPFCFL